MQWQWGGPPHCTLEGEGSHLCGREVTSVGSVRGGLTFKCGAGQVKAGGPAPTGRRAVSRPPCPATQDRQTPLHNAAQWGRKDVAALLLEWGADKEAKNNVSGPMHVLPSPTKVWTWSRGLSRMCEHFHTCVHTF